MTVVGGCTGREKWSRRDDVFICWFPNAVRIPPPQRKPPPSALLLSNISGAYSNFSLFPLNLATRSLTRRCVHSLAINSCFFYNRVGAANHWKLRSSPIYLLTDVPLMSAHFSGHPTVNFVQKAQSAWAPGVTTSLGLRRYIPIAPRVSFVSGGERWGNLGADQVKLLRKLWCEE